MAIPPKSFDDWLIERLTAHGAYHGAADGVHGRAVIAALREFQAAAGLPLTGQADAATVKMLRANAPYQFRTAEPVWLREARRFMGLAEIAGSKSNFTILGWAKALGGWIAGYYAGDDIPWCGLFVGHVIAATLPHEQLPANPLSALAWATIGFAPTWPALGAILVFGRSGGGHVGFYVGEDVTHYHVLGGNQGDAVSIARVAKSRLIAIRWPTTGERPTGGRVMLDVAGAPITTNEA